MTDPLDQGADQPVRLRGEFVRDPHSIYAALRTKGPVHRIMLPGDVPAWLVAGYDEARALLGDPRLSKDNATALRLFPPGTAGGNDSSLSANLLHTDPPDHTRLRTLVTKAFTSRSINRLRPDIEQLVETLLDALPTGVTVDLIREFALPLPIRVICSILGVPAADHDKFAAWTHPFVTQSRPEEVQHAAAATTEYLTALIADKRMAPGNDVLSSLVQASEDGDRLTSNELLSLSFLLILAGFETTANLIGNGVLALLRSPSQMSLLRENPALLPSAVEEFLRYESPLNTATNRFTTEAVTVGEVEIPPGEFVYIALLAANHDDARFSEPDILDITRADNPHLAFGHGIHHCLGAPLARLEGEIAFGRLLGRFRSITLDGTFDDLTYRRSILVRGLNSLPVRLR